jgi:hypothetical protein
MSIVHLISDIQNHIIYEVNLTCLLAREIFSILLTR